LGGSSNEIEASGTLHIDYQGSAFQIINNTASRLNITNGGDISFYEATGTTPKFFWDASAESLGIGLSGPSAPIHTSNTASGSVVTSAIFANEATTSGSGAQIQFISRVGGTNANTYIRNVASSNGNANLIFDVEGGGLAAERMRIDSDGTLTTYYASVFNQNGGDNDFRVESDSNTHALFVNAGNSRVGINDGGPESTLHVRSSGTAGLDFTQALTVEGYGTGNTGDAACIAFAAGDATRKGAITFTRNNSYGRGYMSFLVDGAADSNPPTASEEVMRINSNSVVINENSNDMDFRVESDSSTHMLFVDAGLDRVGINTSTPRTNFDVYGTASVGNNTDYVLTLYGPQDGTSMRFYAGGSNRMNLWTQGTGTDYVSFNSTDNVYQYLTIYRGAGVVVNETALQAHDFRVESDNNANMLTVDAGADLVTISGGSKVANEVLRVNGPQVIGSGSAGVYTVSINSTFTPSAAKYLRIQQSGLLMGGLTITATGDYGNVNAIGCFKKIYSIGANSSNTGLYGAGNTTVADVGATSGQFSMGTPTKPDATTIYIPLENLNTNYTIVMSLVIEFMGYINGISSIDIIDQ